MGQKTSPIGLRLGITQTWRSRWFANKKNYGRFLVEDQSIRRFVRKEYSFAGIARIDIERIGQQVGVIVHAARPGLIIGRRGAKVDKLSEDLEKLIGQKIKLEIHEITQPELNAQVVGDAIVEQLEKRNPYRRIIRRYAEAVMQAGAGGVRIRVGGRLGGAEIARNESLSMGKIPLTTLRAIIDFGMSTAVLSKGTIGVKVWIYKGELLPGAKKETAAHVDAKAGKVPQGAPPAGAR